MFYAYIKKLVLGGEGKWHVIRLGDETEEGVKIKTDFYIAEDWQLSTEEEYNGSFHKSEVDPKVEGSTEPVIVASIENLEAVEEKLPEEAPESM